MIGFGFVRCCWVVVNVNSFVISSNFGERGWGGRFFFLFMFVISVV